MTELHIIMYKMWDKAQRYSRLLDSAHRHLKKFGFRLHLFPRFSNARKRLKRYEQMRHLYMKTALSVAAKIRASDKVESRRNYDH